MQDALQTLISENIAEIKRATQQVSESTHFNEGRNLLHLLQLHSADLRSLCIDDVLLQPVDIVITRVLRPHWHKVPVKAKQLVGELCTLRTLIKTLLKNDCVRYLSQRCSATNQIHSWASAGSTKRSSCAATWRRVRRSRQPLPALLHTVLKHNSQPAVLDACPRSAAALYRSAHTRLCCQTAAVVTAVSRGLPRS